MSAYSNGFAGHSQLEAALADFLRQDIEGALHRKHLSTDSTDAQAVLQELSRILRENTFVGLVDAQAFRDRFSDICKEVMKENGWDRKTMAGKLGRKSPKTVNNWLGEGQTTVEDIPFESVIALARLSDRSVAWFDPAEDGAGNYGEQIRKELRAINEKIDALSARIEDIARDGAPVA